MGGEQHRPRLGSSPPCHPRPLSEPHADGVKGVSGFGWYFRVLVGGIGDSQIGGWQLLEASPQKVLARRVGEGFWGQAGSGDIGSQEWTSYNGPLD